MEYRTQWPQRFFKLNIIQRIIVDYLINLLKCRTVFKWMAMQSCMEFTTFRNALKGKHLSSSNEEIHVFRLSVVSVNYDVDFILFFKSCWQSIYLYHQKLIFEFLCAYCPQYMFTFVKVITSFINIDKLRQIIRLKEKYILLYLR